MTENIWQSENKEENKLLRKKAEPFDFKAMSRREIGELTRRMRRIMKEANGIGLAANQIGLPFRMFVAEVPSGDATKFYAVFNPKIIKAEREKAVAEEGCLSVPGVYGDVSRPEKIILTGEDANGRPVKIKAWGLLARVFQHEVDHLDGTLFIDKAKGLYRVTDRESGSDTLSS